MLGHFAETNTFSVISKKSDAIISIDDHNKKVTVDYGKEGIHNGEIVNLDSHKKCNYYCEKFIENQAICFTSDEENCEGQKGKKSKIRGQNKLSLN